MVVILKNNATEEQIKNIKQHLEDFGFQIHESRGEQKTVLGAIGVKPGFDIRKVKILDGPFSTFAGTIQEIKESKIKLSVSIFNRNTLIDLDESQIIKF